MHTALIPMSQKERKQREKERKRLEKLKRNTCEECGYVAPEKSKLTRHKATQHGIGKMIQCKYCEKKICVQRSFAGTLER